MSPARARVGVSADAFVAVVSAYADRVHDDVRRLGCTPAEAVEVVEQSALGLAERLRVRPHEVGNLVGAWFRDARVLAERVASGEDAADLAGQGIVQRSEDDAAARQALSRLGDRDRMALLLRDAYDLPYVATGVALGLDEDAAAAVVGRARLRLLRLVADDAPDEPDGHDTELAGTARLADGQLSPDDVSAAERHATRCATCGPALTGMREARRLLSGLAILAMPDADRDSLIARATAVAARVLPTAEEVAAAEDEPDPRVLPSWWVAAGCLGGAALLGAVVALSGSDTSLSARGGGGPPTFDPNSPTPTPTPSSATPTPTPTATRPTATATPTPTATASATPTSSPTPSPTFQWSTTSQRISLDRTSGPNEATVEVTGTGWKPGEEVLIEYLNPLGGRTGQQARATPDANGRFVASLVCADPSNIPGPHTVRASNNSSQVATATYNAGP